MDLLRRVRQQFATSSALVPVIIYSADAPLLKGLEPEITENNGVTLVKPFDMRLLIELTQLLIEPKERAIE
jgi:hypothetical protein